MIVIVAKINVSWPANSVKARVDRSCQSFDECYTSILLKVFSGIGLWKSCFVEISKYGRLYGDAVTVFTWKHARLRCTVGWSDCESSKTNIEKRVFFDQSKPLQNSVSGPGKCRECPDCDLYLGLTILFSNQHFPLSKLATLKVGAFDSPRNRELNFRSI